MERKRRTKGFTLVELIVVLIILGILAALLLPTLTGYIEQARRTRAIAECRECVMAANSVGGQYYASQRTEMPFEDNGENETLILELAGQSGDITELVMQGAGTQKLVYTCADGRVVTYQNGRFTLDGDETPGEDPTPEPSPSEEPDGEPDPDGTYRTENLTENDIAYNMKLLLAKYNKTLEEELRNEGYEGDINALVFDNGNNIGNNNNGYVKYRDLNGTEYRIKMTAEILGLTGEVSNIQVRNGLLRMKSKVYTKDANDGNGNGGFWYIALDGSSEPFEGSEDWPD